MPLLVGCGSAPLSMLQPAGPGSADIAQVWWAMLIGFGLVYLGVMALVLYAAYRKRPGAPAAVRWLLVGGGLVLPTAAVLALLLWGIGRGQSLLPTAQGTPVYRVEVRAHQWWWQIRYPDAPGGALYSANELHIPAGVPVDVHVSSNDVIHSFWAPRLGGKIDAIPGRVNVVRLQADAPGDYRGVCSEFCGAQHARMGLVIHAHDADALRARLQQLAGGAHGRLRTGDARAYEQHCAACHSVDPTAESSQPAPNLADLPLRATLGAGTVDNSPAALRYWLRHHQAQKPGNRMPQQTLTDAEVEAIATYLESRP